MPCATCVEAVPTGNRAISMVPEVICAAEWTCEAAAKAEEARPLRSAALPPSTSSTPSANPAGTPVTPDQGTAFALATADVMSVPACV